MWCVLCGYFRYSNWHTTYSDALTKVEHPCILMQGWLYKTGRPSGIFNKQALHRRWFLLKGPYLTYLKSNLHSKPTKDKCLEISGCEIRSLTGHTKGEYAIEILSIPAGAQKPSKSNASTQPTSHAARIRQGSLAHPNQHRSALARGSNPDVSSPEASMSYSGTSQHNLHSAVASTLANMEKSTLSAPSKNDPHSPQPGSKTSTLRRKFMRRASKSGPSGDSAAPPAPNRFVLFASTEIEQVKWVASLQSASRGPLFAPGE